MTTSVTPPPPEPRLAWLPSLVEKALATVVVLGLLAIAGATLARGMADRDALRTAVGVSDVLARSTLEPGLTEDLLAADDPASSAARSRLDTAFRAAIGGASVMRVKLWTSDGKVIYSDESRLIGRRFPLDAEERRALTEMVPISAVSDLSEPENVYERSAGRLVEVYQPIRTPSGHVLLFETYMRYSDVGERSARILAEFAVVAAIGLVLVHLLYLPANLNLTRRLRRLQRRLDTLTADAQSGSDDERRRIAATLHDGVVQDLAATSLAVAVSAEHARGNGQAQLAARLETAAAGVRASIGSLRSLLVDIYPPNLRAAGLVAAVEDLVRPLRNKGVEVSVLAEGELDLDPAAQLLLYRVAQECLRNIDRHSRATRVDLRMQRRERRVRLDIADNGVGFDATSTVDQPAPGHLGVPVMRDLAAAQDARLAVRTAPGAGTRWVLEVGMRAP